MCTRCDTRRAPCRSALRTWSPPSLPRATRAAPAAAAGGPRRTPTNPDAPPPRSAVPAGARAAADARAAPPPSVASPALVSPPPPAPPVAPHLRAPVCAACRCVAAWATLVAPSPPVCLLAPLARRRAWRARRTLMPPVAHTHHRARAVACGPQPPAMRRRLPVCTPPAPSPSPPSPAARRRLAAYAPLAPSPSPSPPPSPSSAIVTSSSRRAVLACVLSGTGPPVSGGILTSPASTWCGCRCHRNVCYSVHLECPPTFHEWCRQASPQSFLEVSCQSRLGV